MTDPFAPPPADPTPAEQLDALSKGLGRAVLWAQAGELGARSLLAACLSDLRHDTQVEDGRSAWLWEMVETIDATGQFRAPILDALTQLPDARSADQLCALACRYAEAGDQPFRDRLRVIVATKPVADSPWLGESEVLLIDGDAGFRFAVRVRGERLLEHGWDWHDSGFVSFAQDQIGAERVDRLLAETTDAAVIRFAQAWRDHEASEREQGPPATRARATPELPVAKVLQVAAAGEEAYRLIVWGRRAAEDDLRTVLARLRVAVEPSELTNLLRVFAARALPEFEPRVVELCRHADPAVRRAAYGALAQHTHPQIRAFALAEIAQGDFANRPVVGLLARNFQPGDEALILAAFRDPTDVNHRHWLLMDVLRVLEANPEADASRLGLLVHGLTPCENCRAAALKLLLRQQVAPDWLVAESRHDASEECRELVAGNPA